MTPTTDTGQHLVLRLVQEGWEEGVSRGSRLSRAIWPDGPASGHGSGAFAIARDRIIAALEAEEMKP